MAWTLCSKEDVGALTSLDIQLLQDSWSTWAEGLITDFIGDAGIVSPLTVSNELHSGDGTNAIYVKNPPIRSVTSVSNFGSAYAASDYTATSNGIFLKTETFPEGVFNISITYVSGGDVDALIKFTCASMIAAIATYYGRKGSDTSFKWGNLPQEYGEAGPNQNVGLTSHLKAIMKNLLKRSRVRIR